MEENYVNGKLEQLMDKFNFDSPIEVTVLIEDEDPPELDFSKDLLVSNTTNVPNPYVWPYISGFSKRTDSNIDIANNIISTAKKNCNNKSIVEKNNQSISVIKPVFPEGHREKTQDIQWQCLDAVADNLIHITKYYYYNFGNNYMEIENNERLKFEYVSFKHQIFDLSYNTTITILLPRESDTFFIKDFIHRIITIANGSLWFQISYEILDKLIRELLIWTKQKKKILDLKLGSDNHEESMDWSSSVLTVSDKLNLSRQALNRPFDNCPTTNHTTYCVPKTYPPAQEMNISPNIKHITNYSTELAGLNISPRIIYPTQDIFNQTSMGPIKNNATPEMTKKCPNNYTKTFNSQPELNILPNFMQRTSHSNQGTYNPSTIDGRIYNTMEGMNCLPYNDSRRNHSTETMILNNNNEPNTNNERSCQATKTNTNKILLSTGPPNQEITISVDTKILANINHQNKIQNNNAHKNHVNEAHGTKSIKRRKQKESSYHPYSNLNRVPHNNANNFNNKNNNCSAVGFKSSVDALCHEDSRKAEYEFCNTDTLRSSISRDSGFGSPLYGGFRNEQTIETPASEEQETPIISHVTSMNPNAVHLNFGFCKICDVTTNNVCIGCYKEYYCSISCQTKDWDNHKYLCNEQIL